MDKLRLSKNRPRSFVKMLGKWQTITKGTVEVNVAKILPGAAKAKDLHSPVLMLVKVQHLKWGFIK